MSNEFNAITDGYETPTQSQPRMFDDSTDNQSWLRTLGTFSKNSDMKGLGFPDGFDFIEQQPQPKDVYAPRNGMYSPVQPFGFEGHRSQTWKAPRPGDKEAVPWREYLEQPVINGDGSTFYTYLGGIKDQHHNNSFIASEKHDPDGRLLLRKAAYRYPVPMKFDLGDGTSRQVNVKSIESCLDPETGIYRTQVFPADASQPDGKSREPLRIITTPDGRSNVLTPNDRIIHQ